MCGCSETEFQALRPCDPGAKGGDEDLLAACVCERRAAARWVGTLLRGSPVLQVSEVIRTQNGPNPSLEMSGELHGRKSAARPQGGASWDGAQGPTFRKLTATRSKSNRLALAAAARSPGRKPQPTALLAPRPVRVPRAGPRCWRPAFSRLDCGPLPANLLPALSRRAGAAAQASLPRSGKASKGRGEQGVRRRYRQ